MSGIAMAVLLDGHVPPIHEARTLAAGAPYRQGEGLAEQSAPSAAAIALRGGEEPRLVPSTPLTTPDGSILLVADARIDNRRDIAAALGMTHAARDGDDVRLLLEAYRRWGTDFADRLSGDFAVAIWDAAHRRVVLARDRMAMRPLVYAVRGSAILVASDVAQVLAAGVNHHVNDARVLAALAGRLPNPEWTFYRDIRRVPPGCTVLIDSDRTTRQDHPSLEPAGSSAGPRDYVQELRSLLEEAVRTRLQVTDAAGLLLSGGLDSLALAGTAAALRAAGAHLPTLTAFTFAYDDLPECDERGTSGAAAAQFGWPLVNVPASDVSQLAEYPAHGPAIDAPDRLQAHVLFDRALDLAKARGLRVLASGQRGDAIAGENIFDWPGRLRTGGVTAACRDLWNHRRLSNASAPRALARHLLKPLARSVWPPDVLPARRERIGAAVDSRPVPPWVRRGAIQRFDLNGTAMRATFRSRLRGEAARRRHETIQAERDARGAEILERSFARAGIRHVAPWGDRALAEWVLGVPQHVLMPRGEPKGLLREALRGLLPEDVRLRAAKRTPRPSYDRGLRRAEPAIRMLLRDSRAAARGYVDERALQTAYERFLSGKRMPRDRFWAFLDVEDWLRRYHD